MTKWEYAWLVAAVDRGGPNGDPALVAIHLHTNDGETVIPHESTRALVELNKLGRKGWEVVSVVDKHVSDGAVTSYLLKRPCTE